MNKIIIFLIFSLFVYPAGALKDPMDYGENECELIMKEYQKEYGGSFVFIQPLKSNGAYDLDSYNGHWINRIGDKYIDYRTSNVFYSIDEIKTWYPGREEVFDFKLSLPPFGIVWHFNVRQNINVSDKLKIVKSSKITT